MRMDKKTYDLNGKNFLDIVTSGIRVYFINWVKRGGNYG